MVSLTHGFLNFIYLFILSRVRSLLPHELFSGCGELASRCGGFSSCGARALGLQASVGAAHGLSSGGSQALEHRCNSCGTQA